MLLLQMMFPTYNKYRRDSLSGFLSHSPILLMQGEWSRSPFLAIENTRQVTAKTCSFLTSLCFAPLSHTCHGFRLRSVAFVRPLMSTVQQCQRTNQTSLQYCIQRPPHCNRHLPVASGTGTKSILLRCWHKSILLQASHASQATLRSLFRYSFLIAFTTPPACSMADGGERSAFLQSFVPHFFIHASLPFGTEYIFELAYCND